MKIISHILISLFLLTALSGCVVFGDGVVTAVEDYYVVNKKAVLKVSGNVASSRLCSSPFSIDTPPVKGKVYQNLEAQTLVFQNDGTVDYIKLNCSGGEKLLEFLNYGGIEKDTVVGIHY